MRFCAVLCVPLFAKTFRVGDQSWIVHSKPALLFIFSKRCVLVDTIPNLMYERRVHPKGGQAEEPAIAFYYLKYSVYGPQGSGARESLKSCCDCVVSERV